MKDLLDLLQKEWGVVAAAPWPLLLIAVLVCGAAYKASHWKHSAIIEHLRERLTLKDEQLDNYREKLLAAQAEGKDIAPLPNAELQRKALELVTAIREWMHRRMGAHREQDHLQWLAMTNARDEGERKRLWDANTLESTRFYTGFMQEYESQFKVKAIVMRDELSTRGAVPSANDRAHYDHPTNPIGVGMVADSLEHMARTLQ